MSRRRRRESHTQIASITYAELRRLNPAAGRQKLLEAFETLRSIRAVARAFKTTRNVVRKALRRFKEHGTSGLDDKSCRPHRSPQKTADALEAMVMQARKRTGYGPMRLHRDASVPLSPFTIRNIIRRHGLKPKQKRTYKGIRRRFYIWEQKDPLSFFQIDLKEILDRKGIPPEAYRHHQKANLPPYQWTACCVRTRIRFLAYSCEKTFANGLLFMLLVILWLRSRGIFHKICFQTDWGEELGGKSPKKLASLDRRIFKPLNAALLRIRKGRTTDNAIVERSHRSDDEEFYSPLLTRYPNTDAFLLAAFRWQCKWNLRRPHFGRYMNGMRPFERAKELMPSLQRDTVLFLPVLLDTLGSPYQLFRSSLPSLKLFAKVGPEVLAHYQMPQRHLRYRKCQLQNENCKMQNFKLKRA